MKNKGWIFLLPGLAGVLIFYVLPFFYVIYLGFSEVKTESLGTMGEIAVLAVCKNEAFRLALMNTLKFMLLAIPLALVFALTLALLLEKGCVGQSALHTALLSPIMVPTVSVVLIWRILFEQNGYVNQVLERIGGSAVDWLHAEQGIVMLVGLFLWKNIGYYVILFLAGLSGIPKEWMETAALEGASPWQMIWHIKIRSLSPTLFFVVLMALIHSFRIFREIYILTGNYPYKSFYMLQHYMNNMMNRMDYEKMSGAAIWIAGIMVVIAAVLYGTERYLGKDMEG